MSKRTKQTSFNQYIKKRIELIREGIIYMMMTDEKTWPVNKAQFDGIMNLVEILNLEQRLYQQKTKMILDLFDVILNYNPKADETTRNAYKDNIQDKINLVKKTISCRHA